MRMNNNPNFYRRDNPENESEITYGVSDVWKPLTLTLDELMDHGRNVKIM
jgi:hypothetical protein